MKPQNNYTKCAKLDFVIQSVDLQKMLCTASYHIKYYSMI